MKRFLLTISLLAMISCIKDKSYNQHAIFFNTKDLSILSLENMTGFWNNDSLRYGSKNYYRSCSGYLGGIKITSDEKGIGVAVFGSQQNAIEAMEARINLVANVINSGDSHDILKGKWWFTDGIPNAIYVNQWNTIVGVTCYHPNFEAVETLLKETTAEITRRINSLSN